jgi:hypothetical protein
MRRNYAMALAVGALCTLASTAHADKYAAEFLKIGVGARALGLGEAYVGIADDASAAYWNPAGLVFVERPEVQAMHAEQFGSIVNYDYLSYAHPLDVGRATSSVIALTLVRTAVDNIPVFDGSGSSGTLMDVGQDGVAGTHDAGEGDGILEPGEYVLVDEAKIQWRSDTDLGFLLSYARPMSRVLAIGATAKLIRQQIVDNSSFGLGADLGVMYTPNDWLSVGLRLADITTTQISWDTGKRETVVPSTRLGLAVMRDLPRFSGVLTLAADANMTYEGRTGNTQLQIGGASTDLYFGAEYWYKRTFALRVGDAAGELAGGAGLRWSRFGLDYAFVGHSDLDTTHRIQGLVRF